MIKICNEEVISCCCDRMKEALEFGGETQISNDEKSVEALWDTARFGEAIRYCPWCGEEVIVVTE